MIYNHLPVITLTQNTSRSYMDLKFIRKKDRNIMKKEINHIEFLLLFKFKIILNFIFIVKESTYLLINNIL